MKAAEYFNNGYTCAESVIMEAIEKGLVPKELLPVATAFSGGMGSGCLCGAVAASSMCLGFLFGRREPHQKVDNCLKLSNEFHDSFKKEFKSTCCRVITKGMEQNSEERKKSCKDVVAFTTETTAKMIMRELNKN